MPRTKDDEDDDDEGPLETEKKRRRASSKGSSSTRRATSSSTRSTRRRPVSGEDLVGSLNGMIAELIKENRQLKRKVERLQKAGSSPSERDIAQIARRIQRAIGTSGSQGSVPRASKRAPGTSSRSTASRRRTSKD